MKSTDHGLQRIMFSGASEEFYRKIGSARAKSDEEGIFATGSTCLSRNGITVPTIRTVIDPKIKE